MHELSVTQGILDIVLSEASRNDVKQVTKINLIIGSLSGVMPQLIQDYFDLITVGTPAEGAKLVIQRIPAELHCEDCGEDSLMEGFRMKCPKCTGTEVKLTKGKEFYIDSMEVEDGNQDCQADIGME